MTKVYKFLVSVFFLIIYGKIKIGKIENIKTIDLKYKSIYKFKIYILKKGRIFTDCVTNVAYIKNNQIIPKISYQQNKHNISSIKYNSTLIKGTPKFKKYYRGKVLSLVQGASGNNYWHWLFDIVPKIELLNSNKILKKIDYFYVPNINQYVVDTFKIFNINKEKLIESQTNKHLEADEIYGLEHLYIKKGVFQKQFKNLPKWIVKFINKKFLKFKKKISCTKKLYIDRSDSKLKHYSISNQDKLINFLKTKGYRDFKLSKLNLFEQIYLFNSSKYIIGPHGAGFANLTFCKSSTKVYEILNANQSYRSAIQTVCKHLNLKHKKIIITKRNNQNSEYNMTVDIDAFKKIIKS